MKKLFNFRLLVLIGVLIMNVSQMWAGEWTYSLTFYCIPEEMFGSNANWNNMVNRKIRVDFRDGRNNYKDGQAIGTGIYYKGYEIYSVTVTGCKQYDNSEGGASYIYFKLVPTDNWNYSYATLGWDTWREMSYINGYIRTKDNWDVYKYDHTISAGSTIVWDMAGNESMWGASYLYKDINGGSGSNDAMTNIAGTHQYYITYDNAVNYVASFQFRSNTSNWDNYSHTTNIERNVSGVTLFTNLNNASGSPAKLNWQVSENAKKANSGVKIYFDNTDANWSAIWLKYGTTWYNRKSANAASKVSGTDNLYVITIPSDVYYAKYYLADNFGWVNYSDIEAAGDAGNLMSNRIASQESNLSSDITYIPSSGDGSTPNVWSTTTISGHTRQVTITAPSHGTITVIYDDESGTEQTKTATHGGSNVVFNVAQTCILKSITATGDNGYNSPASLTVGGSSLDNGDEYIVRGNISISASFSPKTYTASLNNVGADIRTGTASVTATFDATTNLTSAITTPQRTEYGFDGYWTQQGGGGSQLIRANGTWIPSVSGYTGISSTYATWIYYAASTLDLYAKWTQDIELDQNDATTEGSTSLEATYNATLSTAGLENPERTNYTFAGWTNGSGGSGDLIIDKDGVVQTGVSCWTDGSGKWVHSGASTLYAKWTEIKHTVTVQYKYGATSLHDAGSVSNVGVATSQDAEAINITGYTFSTWSEMPDGVTTSDALTSSTITINAIADSKTITANYTPKEYSGTVDKTTGTTDGTYSVTFKTTSLSASGMAKAGYHVDGYYLTYSAGTYDVYIADKDGNLQANKSISTTQYTNGDKEWIYDGNPTIYAHWAENTYTITLYRNDGTSTSTTSEVTMGHNDYDPSIDVLERAGYSFDGFFTETSGGTKVINADGTKPTTSYIDKDANWIYPGDVDLYAHWTPVALTFNNNSGSGDGTWNTAANWSPACVPTSGHDVTISAEVTVSGTAAAKSVTIGSGGKVTIAATGVLEVQGRVTNTDADKLIINTTTSSQGALICDLTSAPTATVNMSIPSGGFHLIASPTGGAKVSSTFAGSGIYTYAWEEGKGWDRRGYYDDFMGNEAILIYGQTSCSFSGILSNACGGSTRYTAEPADESAQGINMLANPLTAPIRIADMTISNSEDGAVHLYNGSWVGKAPGSAGEAVIPAMQGYGVISKSGGGSVSFTYDTAVRGASSKNVPLNAPKRTDSDILDHITLSVTTNDRKVDLELYENEQFTERIDVGWEAIYMEGDGRFGELYALADKKMNILATPDLEGTVLGFVPGQATNYTISFEGDGKGYYLNDLDEQESTLIEEGNTYVFTPNESTNATRFVISKTPIRKTTTGNEAIYDGVKARKQMIDGILYIIRDGRMYDATGVLVK